MYEENRNGFFLKDVLLQIILVVVFVFLLLWLFPTKGYVDGKLESGLEPLYNQLFNDNLAAMKEAAQNYYTTSRLPKKVGDKVSITLGEMLDKKLLTTFVDSNNKQCNLNGSYVEITKMDEEYMMKVNLSCSDKSDYIIVYLGCYNYCDADLCEKQETTTTKPVTTPTKKPSTNNNNNNSNNVTTTVTKYKYQLDTGKYSDWSAWSDWSETKATANNYRQVETKEKKELVGLGHKYLEPDYKETNSKEFTCPTGFAPYGENNTKCVGFKDAYLPKASCKSGYTLNAEGTTCVADKATYTCPNGGELKGTECVKTSTAKNYTSPVANGQVTYSAWSNPVEKEFTSAQVSNETTKYTYVTTRVELDCNNGCKRITKMVYKVQTRTATPSYSCPSGFNWSSDGKTCEKESTASTSYKAVETKKNVAPTMTCKKGSYDSKSGLCSVKGTYESEEEAYCETGTLVTKDGEKKCRIADKKYDTVTYYRYRTRTYLPSFDIKYSYSANDKTLLNKGYKVVGSETSTVTKS